MFKIFLIASVISASLAATSLWGQCGGEGFNGDTNCESGLACIYVNQYYSQCQPGGSGQTTQRTTAQPSGTSAQPITGKFPACQFRVGRSYDQPTTDYSKYDYVSIWINTPASDGSGTDFNIWYQGEMIKATKKAGKIPLFYAYVIAFEGRFRKGLQDCDVSGSNNLCTDGSNFIRDNRALLVSRYRHQATQIANALGDRNAQAIFVIEPDFWQYYGDTHQKGGPLSGEYMRALLDDFAAEIKAALPNALISWDLSAWIGVAGMTKWWGYFKSAPYIDFVHTSGGQGNGGSAEYKPNELKWSEFKSITGKPIIADCGYGVGGGASDNCSPWFGSSINDRIRDGVISLSVANPTNSNVPSKPSLC
jgi:hypothetical protein